MARADGVTRVLRLATASDAPAVAEVWLRSRLAAAPAIPQTVHSDDDVRQWVAEVLIPAGRTWVVTSRTLVEDEKEGQAEVIAMMSLSEGWIEQLYVHPDHQGEGVGSLLVRAAKEHYPRGLDLWTFQPNQRARRFYEHHDFTAVEMTDGDNEEGAPDVRYHWEGE